LTLVAVMLSVVRPTLLILVPLGLLLMASPPRRPVMMIAGLGLAAVAFGGPRTGPLWFAERGYALLLGAWFILMTTFRPAATFLSNALRALAGTLLSALPLFLLNRGGWAQLDWSVSARMRAAAAQLAAAISARQGQTQSNSLGPQFTEQLYKAADAQILVYPALLGLASVAALGLAYWAFRRLTAPDPTTQVQVLAPLREFRFSDELVWLMIAGIALVVLPLGGAGVRVGSNLLTFMGALYAVRGMAVMVALAGTMSVAVLVWTTMAVLLLWPAVIVATLLVGVTDTWLDLRAKHNARIEAQKS
jgi:hypothetical protein